MSDGDRRLEGDATYGELLGEYFTVVNEISRLVDASGQPDQEHIEEYVALREQKTHLLEALERTKPEYEHSNIKSILDDAFEAEDTD